MLTIKLELKQQDMSIMATNNYLLWATFLPAAPWFAGGQFLGLHK
jgi:hypothetical protein